MYSEIRRIVRTYKCYYCNYWKTIVEGYQQRSFNGYQAEQRLSTEYKKWLRQYFGYVLDMPIRLKAGNRPKYRMIHISDHEDGCYLMAKNMQLRKDELFICIQQKGQSTIFDNNPAISSTIDNDLVTVEQIREKVEELISQQTDEISITKFLASFVNDYGLICDFKMIIDSLCKMQTESRIRIRRIPEFSEILHKPTRFWEESSGKKVLILRNDQ